MRRYKFMQIEQEILLVKNECQIKKKSIILTTETYLFIFQNSFLCLLPLYVRCKIFADVCTIAPLKLSKNSNTPVEKYTFVLPISYILIGWRRKRNKKGERMRKVLRRLNFIFGTCMA